MFGVNNQNRTNNNSNNMYIEEGVIYCINYEGKESLVAVFDRDIGAFVDVSGFISGNAK